MDTPDLTRSPRPRLDLTRELIDTAIPRDSGHCVIADAIKSQVSDASDVSVDLATIRWTDRAKGVRYIYLTPLTAQRFLLGFDKGEPLEPQTVRLPSAVQVVQVRARNRATQEHSRQRRAELEEKERRGEPLTVSEQRSLRTSRAHEAKMGGSTIADRPNGEGVAALHYVGDASKRTVKTGGRAPAAGALSHGHGRVRHYGVRNAGSPAPLS